MVATVIRHSSETRLMQFIEVAIDAVDVLLLTLAELLIVELFAAPESTLTVMVRVAVPLAASVVFV